MRERADGNEIHTRLRDNADGLQIHAAAGFGQLWSDIAKHFGLDPEGRVLAAFATHNTWATFLIGLAASVGAGISMAFAGAGVWALVGSLLTAQLITVVLYWVKSDWYPRLEFSYSAIKEMLPYGTRIMFVSILFFLMMQFNNFIVGKFYSETELGYYNRGGRLPDLVVALLQSIVLKLAFPLFAKVRDEKDQLEEVLRRTTQLVAFICFPLLALMLVNASDITMVLFTAKWSPSVIFMELVIFIDLLHRNRRIWANTSNLQCHVMWDDRFRSLIDGCQVPECNHQ